MTAGVDVPGLLPGHSVQAAVQQHHSQQQQQQQQHHLLLGAGRL